MSEFFTGGVPKDYSKFSTGGMPRAFVVGFAGQARAGKDTAADILLHCLKRACKTSFAMPMKSMLEHIGLSHEQLHGEEKDQLDPRFGTTPRRILQTLGTDWGRNMIHPDIWITAMEEQIKRLSLSYDYILIPDVRFENEAVMVRRMGVLFHVKGRGGIEGGHISEAGVKMLPEDFTLLNNGSLARLKPAVLARFNSMLKSRGEKECY